MKNKIILSILAISTVVMVGCKGGGGGGSYSALSAAEQFVDNMNAEDWSEFYYLQKEFTLQEGGWIVIEVDPGDYRAVDINFDERWAYNFDLDYFWDWSFPVWHTAGNVFIDDEGYLYEHTTDTPKDLEKVGAMVEKIAAQQMGEQISADFGLSEKRGVEIARLAQQWKGLSARRSMTDADANAFSQQLLGFSATDAINAVNSNDKPTLDSLIGQAAEKNATSPEHMRELISKFMN